MLGRGDLATSLLLIFPLFLAYEVGVAFSSAQNGVDFVTRNVFALVGSDRRRYLLVHMGLGVAFLALLLWLRRRRKLDVGRLAPVILESGIYALTLGSLIVFVMRQVLGMDPSLAASVPADRSASSAPLAGIADALVLSLGAGVHEELVFRLGLCAGLAALARLAGVAHGLAVVLAFGVSAAAFSAAHHVGPAGDPFTLGVFTYRLLAGLAFAALFHFRSLAHATYTHALYDVYVMVLA